jgi:hypothetical protein
MRQAESPKRGSDQHRDAIELAHEIDEVSPRTSKFLNWSKLAQAGDSITTGPEPSSAAASSAAWASAFSSVPEIS